MERRERKNEVHPSVITMQDRLVNLMMQKTMDTGLNDAEIAQQIGIAKGTLSKYKNGEAIPRIDKLYLIAKYFNVTANYLLDLPEPAMSDPDIQKMVNITGLSEMVIQKIIYEKENNHIDCFNLLLGSNQGFDFIRYVDKFCLACKHIKAAQKNDELKSRLDSYLDDKDLSMFRAQKAMTNILDDIFKELTK